jgi:hypothetical protein
MDVIMKSCAQILMIPEQAKRKGSPMTNRGSTQISRMSDRIKAQENIKQSLEQDTPTIAHDWKIITREELI